jgi:hypothetical protein
LIVWLSLFERLISGLLPALYGNDLATNEWALSISYRKLTSRQYGDRPNWLMGWFGPLKFRLEVRNCSTKLKKPIIYAFNFAP